MTTLAVELSVDQRGPCALYIAADSRVTWGSSGNRWDSVQKTFISNTSPDIFGFCGDAFVAPNILNQVVRHIEAGILFATTASAIERHKRTLKSIQASVRNSQLATFKNFSILHGARDGIGMNCSFRLWKSNFAADTKKWRDHEIKIDGKNSYFVELDGSGSSYLRDSLGRMHATSAQRTSRSAFQQFFQTLKDQRDALSGGAPQIVGIFRGKGARHFGTIWGKSRFFCGSELVAGGNYNEVLWFNDKFERTDGKTRDLLAGAKRH